MNGNQVKTWLGIATSVLTIGAAVFGGWWSLKSEIGLIRVDVQSLVFDNCRAHEIVDPFECMSRMRSLVP
jgi:hypothetical protein